MTQHYFTQHRAPVDETDETSDMESLRWITARARGCTLRLATGAGVFARCGLDAGSALLIETARFADDRFVDDRLADGACICDLGCGWGAVGCFAAALAPRATIWMCDINLRATQLTRHNINENKLANAAVWCGDGCAAARAGCFDSVLCNPPVRAGNTVIAKLFLDAGRCLRDGGALWVVLRTAQGAKSWRRRLEQQFGNCETVAVDGGYRILKSVK